MERPGCNHCLSEGPGRKRVWERAANISRKGRYRQGWDALASRGGSIARAWLAVIRCPLLGIPIVSWLALLTPRALCVVLATLKGQSMVKAGPLEATDPWGGKEGETHLAVTCFGLTDLRVAMAAAAFTDA